MSGHVGKASCLPGVGGGAHRTPSRAHAKCPRAQWLPLSRWRASAGSVIRRGPWEEGALGPRNARRGVHACTPASACGEGAVVSCRVGACRHGLRQAVCCVVIDGVGPAVRWVVEPAAGAQPRWAVAAGVVDVPGFAVGREVRFRRSSGASHPLFFPEPCGPGARAAPPLPGAGRGRRRLEAGFLVVATLGVAIARPTVKTSLGGNFSTRRNSVCAPRRGR